MPAERHRATGIGEGASTLADQPPAPFAATRTPAENATMVG